MKLKLILYTGIALCIASCGGNNDKKVDVADSSEPMVLEDTTTLIQDDSALDVEMIDTFTTTAFSDYAKRQSSGFDWTQFRMTSTWVDDSLLTASFSPDKTFYADYGKLIKYSPDSSMFVDLDSYNMDITRDSKGRLVGTELGPDSEVSLVNLKNKQKKRLVFLGPGGSIEDALWLDKENLVLMGVQEHNDSSKVAAVWKIHVPTNTFYLYELPNSEAAQKIMGNWRKERLKSVQPK